MTGPEAPVLRDALPARTTWTPRESRLTAGVARTDITAPVGVRAHNWGASRTEVATGVHRPLTATALAFYDEAAPAAQVSPVHAPAPVGRGRWRFLLTLDLGWWRDAESFERLRDPLLTALGADADDLLLHLVHTHAGPSICDIGLDLPGAQLLDGYQTTLLDACVRACAQARDTAADAVITWSYGRSDLAVVRNLACGARDVVALDPDAVADDTLAVARITAAGSTGTDAPSVLGVLVNYACHPTTLAHENSLLSPDFVGATREVVEAATGAPCLFLQGASGELSPRDQYVVGPAVADRNGRSLGHAAVAAVEGMGEAETRLRFDGVVESGAPLGLWVPEHVEAPRSVTCSALTVALPAKPRPSAAERAEQWAHIDPVAAAERTRRAARVADGYVTDGSADHPLWVWQLGDAAIVAHPGEAFSLLQTELRRRHPERVLLVLNLTNGPGFVYLPDRESYDRDRYQVWQTVLAPGCLEALVDAADAALTTLPRPREALA